MTLHPRLSKAAVELVKSFEGLRRRAARLDGGGWTIGYGHTLSAREGAEVTAEEAEALLLYDLDKIARAIEPLVTSALNANQFAALTAFAFNIGLEKFKTSAVLKHVNEAAFLQAAAAIELWRRAEVAGDALMVDGLIRRRAAEKALFLTPPEGFKPVSSAVLKAVHDTSAADLSNAVDLWVSLAGDVAGIERQEAPGAATTAAIRNVTAHLQALFPDDAAEAPPAEAGEDVVPPVAPSEVAAEAPVQPQPEPSPAPVIAPAPPAAPLVLEPAPAYEPHPVYEPEPPPPPAEEPPPPPSLFEPGRYPPIDYDDLPEGFRTRPVSLDVGGETVFAAQSRAAPTPRVHAPVVLLVGLGGAAMFVGSLFAMIYAKATITNLVIGLLGVICMAPAGLKLLLRLFGERDDGQDA